MTGIRIFLKLCAARVECPELILSGSCESLGTFFFLHRAEDDLEVVGIFLVDGNRRRYVASRSNKQRFDPERSGACRISARLARDQAGVDRPIRSS